MVRILCIGNRFYYPDDFGIRIYEALLQRDLGSEIEVVEGGVGGMNLALYFEDDAEILIVDYGRTDQKIMHKADIDAIDIASFDHANAFLYLLKTVSKEYTIYLCNEDYKKHDLASYCDEVVALAKDLACK